MQPAEQEGGWGQNIPPSSLWVRMTMKMERNHKGRGSPNVTLRSREEMVTHTERGALKLCPTKEKEIV